MKYIELVFVCSRHLQLLSQQPPGQSWACALLCCLQDSKQVACRLLIGQFSFSLLTRSDYFKLSWACESAGGRCAGHKSLLVEAHCPACIFLLLNAPLPNRCKVRAQY